jgi:hypothetical protein
MSAACTCSGVNADFRERGLEERRESGALEIMMCSENPILLGERLSRRGDARPVRFLVVLAGQTAYR